MSLGQIISGLYLTTKLAMASPDTAVVAQNTAIYADTTKTEQVTKAKEQDNSKVANPFNIKLETGLSNVGAHPVKFQRGQISNKDFELKYDFNGAGKDVARLTVNLPNKMSVAFYNIGNMDGKDYAYWEASKVLKVGNNSTMLFDGGTGIGKGREPEYFLIANIKNDKLFVEGAIYEKASRLKDLDKSIFALAAYDFGHEYLGVGKNRNTLVGVAGVKDFKDVGMITYALYDKETKGWTISSQTAVGDVNQKFFSKDNFDFVTEYFAIPVFFPTHFTPQVTKGDYSIKINGTGLPGKTELEAKLGFRNEIVSVSAGVNTLNENGKTDVGAVIELYKPFKLFGADCYGEAKYNTRSGDITGYIGVNFNQK